MLKRLVGVLSVLLSLYVLVEFYLTGKTLATRQETPPTVEIGNLLADIDAASDNQNQTKSEGSVNSDGLPSVAKDKDDGSWLVTEGQPRLSLYNAYWDNRSDLAFGPVIRLLGLSDFGRKLSDGEQLPFRVGCFVSCDPDGRVVRQVPYDDRASVKMYIPRTVMNVSFDRHVFTCRLADPQCTLPYRVTLVTARTANISLPHQVLDASNSLPIEYPIQRQDRRNETEVGLCGPILFGAINPYRLLEWIEMLRLLGVSRLVLYNHSVDAVIQRILEVYQAEGLVELRQIGRVRTVAVLGPDEYRSDIYTLGPVSLCDCMYRNMFLFRWMVVLDIDELILPRDHMTYPDLLKQLQSVYPNRRHVGFKFMHVDFILDPILEKEPDPDVPWQLSMLRHRTRFNVRRPSYHAKSIIDPTLCTAMHYHDCSGYLDEVRMANVVSAKYALDCHYRSRLCPDDVDTYEACIKALRFGEPSTDDIILRYKDDLMRSVNSKLKLLGLEVMA